jgi:hypothetical protein
MDPYSRRFTWNVIRKYREGRVVIFSTHFMDEADILSDRIAIMAKGQVRACGSSLFLKNHFGVGYNMVVERRPDAEASRVRRFVLDRVPSAKVLSDVGAEISFQLPLSASASFQPLFEAIDDQQEDLGVETYGMSVTTLGEGGDPCTTVVCVCTLSWDRKLKAAPCHVYVSINRGGVHPRGQGRGDPADRARGCAGEAQEPRAQGEPGA